MTVLTFSAPHAIVTTLRLHTPTTSMAMVKLMRMQAYRRYFGVLQQVLKI